MVKDILAVRIGADPHTAVAGAPSYFASRPKPKLPRDLMHHAAINLRLLTHGGLFTWFFGKKSGKTQRLHCDRPLVFSNVAALLAAAFDGFGLAVV